MLTQVLYSVAHPSFVFRAHKCQFPYPQVLHLAISLILMLTLHLAVESVESTMSNRTAYPVDKEHGGDEQTGDDQGVEKKGDVQGGENLDAD